MATINNTGSTLTVPSNGLSGARDFTGTITGGTVIDAFPTLDFGGATLQNLLWQGTLAAYSGVLYDETVTVQGLDGSQGTILLGNATLAVEGDTLVDHVTLRVIGSTAALAIPNFNNDVTLGAAGTIAIFDPGATLDVSGYQFSNDGTINLAGTTDALVAQEYVVNNHGLIALSDGAVFAMLPSTSSGTSFVNAGSITVASGARLVIGPHVAQFTNTGTIVLPDSTSTLEIDDNLASSSLGTIDSAGGTLCIGGTLNNAGQTLTIGAPTGFGALTFDGLDTFGFGTIVGGTVVNTGTVGLGGAGVLNNVVWQGTLVVGNSAAFTTNITLDDPNDLQPSAGGGMRDVVIAGQGGNLYFGNSQVNENDVLSDYNIVDTAEGGISDNSTLTLDSTTTISVVGGTVSTGITLIGGGSLGQGFGLGANLLINNGLINDALSDNQNVYLDGGIFDNAGTILVSGAGNTGFVNAGSFVNTGSVLVSNSATLWLNANPGYVDSGPLANTGLIALDASSTLVMAGTYTSAMLTGIATSGGAVLLTGTLDNTGNTISLAPDSEFDDVTLGPPVGSPDPLAPGLLLSPLIITGGTIQQAGASFILQNLTLDAATWIDSTGPFSLTGTNDTLAFINSALLDSADRIDMSGTGNTLSFDSATFSTPSATIDVTGAGDDVGFTGSTLANTTLDLGGEGGTLTLDGAFNTETLAASATVNVTVSAGGVILATGINQTIVNQGLIDDQSGDLQIGYPPPTPVGDYTFGPLPPGIPQDAFLFDNQGTIIAAGGAGSTFTIGVQTSLTNEGLIQVNNNARLLIENAAYETDDLSYLASPYFSNTGTFAIGNGTIEFAGSVATTGTIAFTTNDTGILIFDTPGTATAGPLLNLGTGDRIEFGGGMTITGVSMIATSTVEVTLNDSTGLPSVDDLSGISFAGDATQFTYGVDATTGDAFIEAIPCFLPGTQIATPTGEVSVERLAVGDTVKTASGETKSLVWIGTGQAVVSRGRRTAATPVIVRKGALADNVPHRDLRITKGHSLYLDGVLIPVEYLINHRSVLWDDMAQVVTVYHLELQQHDLLLANGAPAESFRDDGNRWLFQNAFTNHDLSPKPPCAPVLTGGPVVDAVWRRLLDRAGPRPSVPLTHDPDLHLVVDGVRVEAVSQQDGIYVFALRTQPDDVRIVSRAAVPQELGVARDPRQLGVALRRMAVRQGTRFQTFRIDDPLLTHGFHALEPRTGLRWTNGNAALPRAMFARFAGPCEVVLHLGGTARYIEETLPRVA
jgi:hypothetical protein